MTTPIPRSALLLGLAGVIPFAWGALTIVSPELNQFGVATFGPRFVGPYVQLFYGAIILSFMSGVLWGFTAKSSPTSTMGYVLSVIPALWAFFMTGGGPTSAAISLIAGFIGLLGIDWLFWKQNLAPEWWMNLRILLTVLVTAFLSVGVIL